MGKTKPETIAEIANTEEALKASEFETIEQAEVTDAQDITSANEAERHAWISEAAYRLAEARDFAPGYELQDWLEAEREFDSRI